MKSIHISQTAALAIAGVTLGLLPIVATNALAQPSFGDFSNTISYTPTAILGNILNASSVSGDNGSASASNNASGSITQSLSACQQNAALFDADNLTLSCP